MAHGLLRVAIAAEQLDGEAALLDAQANAIGAVMAGDGETVALSNSKIAIRRSCSISALRFRIERSSSWMSMMRGSGMALC